MWDAEPHPIVDVLIGLDLAQGGADFTAISVVERADRLTGDLPGYDVIWLDRWRDRRTALIPERVSAMTRQLRQRHAQRHLRQHGSSGDDLSIMLVVDQTGVGPFGLDPLRDAGFHPVGIVIHGGDAVSHPDSHTYRVPKRDLAGAVNILLQSSRLHIANTLPEAATLKAELENFRAKITLTGHDRYEAGPGEEWRVGAHDDLVLSVACAVWMGEAHPAPRLDPVIAAAWGAPLS